MSSSAGNKHIKQCVDVCGCTWVLRWTCTLVHTHKNMCIHRCLHILQPWQRLAKSCSDSSKTHIVLGVSHCSSHLHTRKLNLSWLGTGQSFLGWTECSSLCLVERTGQLGLLHWTRHAGRTRLLYLRWVNSGKGKAISDKIQHWYNDNKRHKPTRKKLVLKSGSCFWPLEPTKATNWDQGSLKGGDN